ncbi:MAG: LicD family protein [Lachnospiraceae bacterium]|nr:LicD family protein [Lachnospiraceae bacterium]
MKKYEGISREGFYIRPMVQRVWDVQLDMLKEIDRVCRKYGIRWYVDWGTLLGTVRHKGYIPWDDDLDISMMRLDFERFKKNAMKELPQEYVCQIDRGNELKDLVFRIKNQEMISTDPVALEKNHGCPYIVGIDIFVYDNIPDDLTERDQYLAMFTYAFAAAADPTPDMLFEECSDETKELIRKTEYMTGINIDRSRPVKSILVALADHIAAMYYDTETAEIAHTCFLPHDRKYAFLKEWFLETEYKDFEEIQVPVPKGYDKVLTRLYGEDYMIPHRRYMHNYPYFENQEQALFSWFNSKQLDIPDDFRE